VRCDDENPCTSDRCDATLGCVFEPGNEGGACDDGEPCTDPDACAGGRCAGGPPPDCDDSDPCTNDRCVLGEGCENIVLIEEALPLGALVKRRPGDPDGPAGLIFSAKGDLLVSSYNSDEVLAYDASTGAFVGTFVEAGSGGLSGPVGLAVSPADHHLYVASSRSSAVLRYDGFTGELIDEFVLAYLGGLEEPRGLAFDDDDNLLVASAGTDAVLRYDGTTGALLAPLVSGVSGVLASPDRVAVDPFGFVYVGHAGTPGHPETIVRLDPATGQVTGPTLQTGDMGRPAGLVVAGLGGLLAVDAEHDAVRRIDLSGQDPPEELVAGHPTPAGDDHLTDIAMALGGKLFVTAFDSDAVRTFNVATGAPLPDLVTPTHGGVDGPDEVLLGPDGRVYVTSLNNERVLRYEVSGAFVDVVASTRKAFGAAPGGVAFDSGGELFVAATGRPLIGRFDSSTALPTKTFELADAQAWGASIAFDSEGILFVASPATNSIRRYTSAAPPTSGPSSRAAPATSSSPRTSPSGPTATSTWSAAAPTPSSASTPSRGASTPSSCLPAPAGCSSPSL